MKKSTIQLLLIAAWVMGCTAVAWFCNLKSLLGIDDANIYMVYMRNLAEGHGFVYNPGGERVEGFTSLLWTLIGAGLFGLTSKPYVLFLIINVALITWALWQLVRYLDDTFNDDRILTPHSLLLLGMLGVIPGFFEWTVLSFLETGLWSALLTLMVLSLLRLSDAAGDSVRSRIEFCVLTVLLVLCRPESMLWCAAFVAIRFAILYQSGKFLQNMMNLAFPAGTFAGALGGLVLWRKMYFGFPLPNTYYAKVSSDRIHNLQNGCRYISEFFFNNPPAAILLVLAGLCTWRICQGKRFRESCSYLILVAVVMVTFFIPLYTGGDHFKFSRFMQPTVPLLFACLLLSLHRLKFSFQYRGSIVLVLICLIIPACPLPRNIANRVTPLAQEWHIASIMRERSQQLTEFFEELPQYPAQGVLTAGGSAFGYKGQTIDLLGLNNVEMAHSSTTKNAYKNHSGFNKEVFFKQKPDLFWLGGPEKTFFPLGFIDDELVNEETGITASSFYLAVFKYINEDPRFKSTYSPVAIRRKGADRALVIFASNDFLEKLDNTVYSYNKVIDESNAITRVQF